MRTAVITLAALTLASLAQAQPIVGSDPLPRALTPEEAAWIKRHPIVADQSRVAPPGPVRTPAEYDPAEGILIAWEGTTGWLNILAQMARDITTIGNAQVFVVTDNTSERTSASSAIQAEGADMSRVQFVIRTTDSIWIRDYGPRYIYLGVQPDGSGGVRAIVDHTYNRPRPNDNALPSYWATLRDEPRFAIPLVHGGGNYHLESGDPAGVGHATRLIVNENPSLTESQIIGYWRDYQNLETTLYTPYPTSVDSTQHIDMWMIMLDDDKVMISEWVNEPSSPWNITSNNAAAAFAARGFTVYRVPAVRSGGTHYTFTNAVICNDLVLIPSYTNSTASVHNSTALATWQAALPGKTVRQIPSQAIVTYAGVLHCIVMHVPAPSGGEAPSVYLTSHNDGAGIDPGTLQIITWLTDDDEGATTADFYLSTDAGATYPTLLASGVPAGDESYYWTVPNLATSNARIKILVHDADGNTGFDETDLAFTINGTGCVADWNHDDVLDFFDVAAFLDDFAAQDPVADLTDDGTFDFFDVSAFLAAFSTGCP
ncbi:MAG: hypothetical protein DYG94_07690 [Leptolyngbya sp. PLA3]|nr:MAG: hypothetical protein EDM82_10405 [Cyanobacteria bacterium CYA]MCE7968612.1 hypothetical protein [Leptolyngbya sp. PL-A3]